MGDFSRREAALALLGGLTAGGCSSARPAASISDVSHIAPAQAQSISSAAEACIASGRAVGVAVEVSKRGQTVFAHGFGRTNTDSDEPVTPATVFRVGSVSKPFTAAAILQLVQQRKLSLDDTLSLYYPNFPRGGEVTIRRMLNHTSGIHNYTEFGADPLAMQALLRDHTTDEWAEHIAHQDPLYDFTPGSAWHYSNSGFYLAGAIVEKVSGKAFSVYMHDHIFSPLGMSQTAVDGNSDIGPGRALGYVHASGGGFERPMSVSMTVAGGAGAIRSSADDLIKWANGLFAGAVVDRSLLAAMLTPARLTDGRLASLNRVNEDGPGLVGDYGLGVQIEEFEGHRAIGHPGDIPGFAAALKTYPDEDMLTVAILANTQNVASELEQQIARIMLNRA